MIEDKYSISKEDSAKYDESCKKGSKIKCPDWWKKCIYYVKSNKTKEILIFTVEDRPYWLGGGFSEHDEDKIEIYVKNGSKYGYELIRTISEAKLKTLRETPMQVEFIKSYLENGYTTKWIH